MNPNFQKYISNQANKNLMQQTASRYGIIQDYDPITNTATVLLPDQDSDAIGEVLRSVPCPVTLGVEMAAPEAGRPCWVAMRRGQSSRGAIITNYFHHNFANVDGPKKSNMRSGIPMFMSRM